MTTSKNIRRGVVITRASYTTPLPPSLAIETIHTGLMEPYRVGIVLTPPDEGDRHDPDGSGRYSRLNRLIAARSLCDDSMGGADILPGDFLIYDGDRTTPTDGAIMWIQDGKDFLPRIARVAGDVVEYHPAAPGYPVLSGERKVWGTVAALVRVYGALATAPEDDAEGGES